MQENEVVQLLIFCLFVASLSKLINDCFEKEMIFRRYYLRLVYYWIKWHKRKDRWKRQILKPLGLCQFCFNVWITSIMFVLFYGFKLEVLLTIGTTHLILKIFEKLKL